MDANALTVTEKGLFIIRDFGGSGASQSGERRRQPSASRPPSSRKEAGVDGRIQP